MRVVLAPSLIKSIGVVAGGVFAYRKKTNYIRHLQIADKWSPAQIEAQKAFRAVDLSWRMLGTDDKQAWRDYQSWRKNFGYNRFQKVNIPRYLSGDPLLANPDQIP